jgi:hypothetical protein
MATSAVGFGLADLAAQLVTNISLGTVLFFLFFSSPP